MTFGRYVLGVGLLLVVIASAGFGAVALRRHFLPLWSGALARLAETVAALAIVVGVAELMGIVGAFMSAFVVAGCVVTGAAFGVLHWPQRGIVRQRSSATAVSRLNLAAALAGTTLVLAHWATPIAQSFNGGMLGADTLGYHGPIAASFAQQASIIHPPTVYTDPVVAFYPAGSELIHAVGIILFSRDLTSPIINMGWLFLALLAAWCAGRPRGVSAASVLAAAAVLDLPALSMFQPGNADNDVMALALLLSSVALLFHAYAEATDPERKPPIPPTATALAGAAAGLALGTKLSMVAPVGLLTLGVLLVVRDRWCRIAWLSALIGSGAIWYVRNFIAFGNPVPALHLSLGPLALPSARLPPSNDVAQYFTKSNYWHYIFLPGLHQAFTWMWPALLGVAILGAIMSAGFGPTALDRVVGIVATLAAVAYTFTPRSADAGGFFFTFNLRYLTPALLLGVLLLVRLPPVARVLRQPWALLLPGAALVVDLAHGPQFGTTSVVVAFAVGALLFVAWSTWSTRRVTTYSGAIVLSALAALGVLAWPVQRSYLNARYMRTTPWACGLISCTPFRFAQLLHRARIADAGGLVGSYLFYGRDLSNVITVIEHRAPNGTSTPITSCPAWRRAVNASHSQYLVISASLYLWPSQIVRDETTWTRTDPAVTELSVAGDQFRSTTSVFRIHGLLDPSSCEQPESSDPMSAPRRPTQRAVRRPHVGRATARGTASQLVLHRPG